MSDPLESRRSKALYLISSIDLWERFSFHGMRAMLVLFLVSSISAGGFAQTQETSLKTYGTYLALVYISPLLVSPALRFIGHFRGLIIGASVILVGHICLGLVHLLPVVFSGDELLRTLEASGGALGNWTIQSIEGEPLEISQDDRNLYFAISISFHASLLMIILGTGFFKSSTGSLISRLYQNASDNKRESAFTIEYLLINIGAFAAPLIAGTIGTVYGWHYGFSLAALGMGIGLVGFLMGSKRLIPQDLKRKQEPSPVNKDPSNGTKSSALSDYALLIILFAILAGYWTIYEQWGGLINIFTDLRIDRTVGGVTVPAAALQSLNPMFIMLLAPILVRVSLWLDSNKIAGINVNSYYKLAASCFLLSITFLLLYGASVASLNSPRGMAGLYWLVGVYFFMAMSELLLAPVALSLLTRIAPAALLSVAVGAYYATNSAGAFLSGFVGSSVEVLGESALFALLAGGGFVLSVFAILCGQLPRNSMSNKEGI